MAEEAEQHSPTGWIVGDSTGMKFRCWEMGNPAWTDDPLKATRYFRRKDAQDVHDEDIGAWTLIPAPKDP